MKNIFILSALLMVPTLEASKIINDTIETVFRKIKKLDENLTIAINREDQFLDDCDYIDGAGEGDRQFPSSLRLRYLWTVETKKRINALVVDLRALGCPEEEIQNRLKTCRAYNVDLCEMLCLYKDFTSDSPDYQKAFKEEIRKRNCSCSCKQQRA